MGQLVRRHEKFVVFELGSKGNQFKFWREGECVIKRGRAQENAKWARLSGEPFSKTRSKDRNKKGQDFPLQREKKQD